MLAVRISYLTSALHPDYLDTRCPCQGLGCGGNRLERCYVDGDRRYKVVIIHAKTDDSYGHEETNFTLPSSWCEALAPWVEEGHKLMAQGSEWVD